MRDVTHLLRLIADSFEVGDRFDDRQDHAQVTGRGRTDGKKTTAVFIDRHLHVVDLEIAHRHRLAQRAVALDQSRHSFLQLLFHESAHGQHTGAEPIELVVVTARDVMV